jgi:hypothetical protein
MNTFTEVCSQLGVPIADDKTEGPSTMITYSGLLIDTEKMLIQIPDAFHVIDFPINTLIKQWVLILNM